MATRAGTFPRQQAREAERRSLRKNWRRLGQISLIPGAAGLLIWWLWPQASIPTWALPMVLWAVIVGSMWPQLHGSYSRRMGAEAETWTSNELTRLGRAGARHFDHVPFDRFDIDHVLVHPSGVYVLETKYTDREVDLASRGNDPMLQDWTRNAVRGKEKMRRFLVTSHRLPVDITPLVICWGSDIRGDAKEVDGVLIVRGGVLVKEIEGAAPLAKLDLRKQTALCDALASFIAERDLSLKR